MVVLPRLAMLAALALALGCRSRPRPAPPDADEVDEPTVPSVSSAASVRSALPARCAPVTRGAAFTVGDPEPDGTGDGEDLPFAVEIGRAAALDSGFAVGALGTRERGTAAFVALVGADGASGRVLDLGLTHGTFEPPLVVGRGADLFLLVPDSDAGGNVLRLGVARAAQAAKAVTWGPSLGDGWDDSESFDLAVGAERGVAVWDRWVQAKDRGTLRAVDFDPSDVSRVSKVRDLDLGSSVEGPRIIARPGGFWLAATLRHGPAPAEGARRPADDGELDVSDRERRSLVVVPLDGHGAVLGKPVAVTAVGLSVVIFDLAAAPDGAAILASRADADSPGMEGGAVQVARVTLDGNVQRLTLDDDELGTGAPVLVAESSAGGEPGLLWLAAPSAGEGTALVALGGDGRPRDAIGPEAALGHGQILSRRGDRLLVATPRGRSAELSVLRCHPGSPPPPASARRAAEPPPLELPE